MVDGEFNAPKFYKEVEGLKSLLFLFVGHLKTLPSILRLFGLNVKSRKDFFLATLLFLDLLSLIFYLIGF